MATAAATEPSRVEPAGDHAPRPCPRRARWADGGQGGRRSARSGSGRRRGSRPPCSRSSRPLRIVPLVLPRSCRNDPAVAAFDGRVELAHHGRAEPQLAVAVAADEEPRARDRHAPALGPPIWTISQSPARHWRRRLVPGGGFDGPARRPVRRRGRLRRARRRGSAGSPGPVRQGHEDLDGERARGRAARARGVDGGGLVGVKLDPRGHAGDREDGGQRAAESPQIFSSPPSADSHRRWALSTARTTQLAEPFDALEIQDEPVIAGLDQSIRSQVSSRTCDLLDQSDWSISRTTVIPRR